MSPHVRNQRLHSNEKHSYNNHLWEISSDPSWMWTQEAPLSQRNCTTHSINWNLGNCCTAVWKQVAQLSLTNPRDALHHHKWQNLKTVTWPQPRPLLVICHPVARIDIAYSCTKFDDFRFSCSSDMIGALKICNGSHDLTTPLSGTVCRP